MAQRDGLQECNPSADHAEIDDSLRRLRTDRIDIYHVHWPDLLPIGKLPRRCALYERGKIGAIG